MWVDRVNTILGEDPESLDLDRHLVDLGRIGDFGLSDKICERLINFDGDRCDGCRLNLPNALNEVSDTRFYVPSGESACQLQQILHFPIRISVVLHSSWMLAYATYADNVAAKFVSTRPIVAEAAC